MTAFIIDSRTTGLDINDVWQRANNRRGLMAVLGREAQNVTIRNFRMLQGRGNRLDAASTGYYEGAAQATQSNVISDSAAVVSINQVGIRLHYLGGEVVPVTKKWLTIPAIAEAHGKRATEFKGLWLMKKHGAPIALARTAANERGFEIVYWLRKSVKHLPEPDTLPGMAALSDALRDRARRYYARSSASSQN